MEGSNRSIPKARSRNFILRNIAQWSEICILRNLRLLLAVHFTLPTRFHDHTSKVLPIAPIHTYINSVFNFGWLHFVLQFLGPSATVLSFKRAFLLWQACMRTSLAFLESRGETVNPVAISSGRFWGCRKKSRLDFAQRVCKNWRLKLQKTIAQGAKVDRTPDFRITAFQRLTAIPHSVHGQYVVVLAGRCFHLPTTELPLLFGAKIFTQQ